MEAFTLAFARTLEGKVALFVLLLLITTLVCCGCGRSCCARRRCCARRGLPPPKVADPERGDAPAVRAANPMHEPGALSARGAAADAERGAADALAAAAAAKPRGAASSSSRWQAHVDSATGLTYYYDPDTGRSTWSAPSVD